jgi:hypothetical protein
MHQVITNLCASYLDDESVRHPKCNPRKTDDTFRRIGGDETHKTRKYTRFVSLNAKNVVALLTLHIPVY